MVILNISIKIHKVLFIKQDKLNYYYVKYSLQFVLICHQFLKYFMLK